MISIVVICKSLTFFLIFIKDNEGLAKPCQIYTDVVVKRYDLLHGGKGGI